MEYREVIIFVIGTTPQIVTETLYALHHKNPPVQPSEIFIITTTVGKEKLEKELIEKDRLKAFYHEFNMQELLPEVCLVKDISGSPLKDIRTDSDNENIGDFIVNFIKEKTMDEHARLHCSIAGGRKTMSFYLGSALSLFGRPWDRLHHILVTPEFESHPDFYWKPKVNRTLEVRGQEGKVLNILNTGDADITLAELPFIRLRDKFPLNGKGFKELVLEGQREIDTASIQLPLTINISERTIKIGQTTIEMVPMQLIIYNAFLREKIGRCRYPERPYCLDCTDCFTFLVDLSNRRAIQEMAKDYRVAYRRNIGRVEDFLAQWKEGMDVPVLRQNVSKINKVIREHLPDETLSSFYAITTVGRHGNKRHGVKVEKRKIAVEP